MSALNSSNENNSELVAIFKELLSLRTTVQEIEKTLVVQTREFNERCSKIETMLSKPKRSLSKEGSISPLQLKILNYLFDGPKTQSEIFDTLKIPQSSVSHSLNKLEKELNIVESRPTLKEGARLEYLLKNNIPEDLLELLRSM